MSRLVGIDLGTTNSLVAIAEGGVPQILADADGRKIVPSITYFKEDGSVLVGDSAREKLIDDPEHTIFSIKRFMGKGLDDIQDDLDLLPFKVSPESENIVRINILGRDYTPPELSAFVLR